MKLLLGFTVLLAFQLIGEILARGFSLPVPGPVIGMGLLFGLLILRGQSFNALDDASSALLKHFSLLFVPAGVGIMLYFDELRTQWLPITLTIVITTVATFILSAVLMQKLQQKRSKSPNE